MVFRYSGRTRINLFFGGGARPSTKSSVLTTSGARPSKNLRFWPLCTGNYNFFLISLKVVRGARHFPPTHPWCRHYVDLDNGSLYIKISYVVIIWQVWRRSVIFLKYFSLVRSAFDQIWCSSILVIDNIMASAVCCVKELCSNFFE